MDQVVVDDPFANLVGDVQEITVGGQGGKTADRLRRLEGAAGIVRRDENHHPRAGGNQSSHLVQVDLERVGSMERHGDKGRPQEPSRGGVVQPTRFRIQDFIPWVQKCQGDIQDGFCCSQSNQDLLLGILGRPLSRLSFPEVAARSSGVP